ncbi:MAG: hypothetical protein ACR2QK_09645 [Acidimicrobiales bacterium]
MAQESVTDPGPEFELRLAQIGRRRQNEEARRHLWLAHHWPEEYRERCVRLGSRHVCRRCAALYQLGFAVAFIAAAGYPPWPSELDPMAIWVLSIPATVAFVGEAIGLFRYSPKWQVATTLLAAAGFGRALGYELLDRWSPEFLQPIAVFGGLWFFASAFAATTRPSALRRVGMTRPAEGASADRSADARVS